MVYFMGKTVATDPRDPAKKAFHLACFEQVHDTNYNVVSHWMCDFCDRVVLFQTTVPVGEDGKSPESFVTWYKREFGSDPTQYTPLYFLLDTRPPAVATNDMPSWTPDNDSDRTTQAAAAQALVPLLLRCVPLRCPDHDDADLSAQSGDTGRVSWTRPGASYRTCSPCTTSCEPSTTQQTRSAKGSRWM